MGWRVIGSAGTRCGRKDNYRKEQGRQFSMVRALKGADIPKPVKAELITAYIRSAKRYRRNVCLDMARKGVSNLYDAVFSEVKI